jgi:hypothetical protein
MKRWSSLFSAQRQALEFTGGPNGRFLSKAVARYLRAGPPEANARGRGALQEAVDRVDVDVALAEVPPAIGRERVSPIVEAHELSDGAAHVRMSRLWRSEWVTERIEKHLVDTPSIAFVSCYRLKPRHQDVHRSPLREELLGSGLLASGRKYAYAALGRQCLEPRDCRGSAVAPKHGREKREANKARELPPLHKAETSDPIRALTRTMPLASAAA